MSPFVLIVLSFLLQSVISCIGSMFCGPRLDKNSDCISINLANSSNFIISLVVILMLANVIPMPGSKDVAAAAMETTG